MTKPLALLTAASILVSCAAVHGQPPRADRIPGAVQKVPPVIVVVPNRTSGPWGVPSAPAYAPGLAISIHWHYTGNPPGDAKVTLLRDGQAVKVLKPATAWGAGGEGGLLWAMPEDQYGFHLFRIQVASTVDADYRGTSAEFASMPMIRVSEPTVSGQAWKVGTAHTVSWLHSGGCGDSVNLKAILTSARQVYDIQAAWPIGAAFTGTMSWTVPASIPAGEYRIHLKSSQSTCNDRTIPFTIIH